MKRNTYVVELELVGVRVGGDDGVEDLLDEIRVRGRVGYLLVAAGAVRTPRAAARRRSRRRGRGRGRATGGGRERAVVSRPLVLDRRRHDRRERAWDEQAGESEGEDTICWKNEIK